MRNNMAVGIRSKATSRAVVCALVVWAIVLPVTMLLQAQEAAVAQAQEAAVPRLVQFSGVLRTAAGKPLTGVQGVTFALYREQEGGSPLWLETQNVQADEHGRFAVLLGAARAEAMPLELFSAHEARWLGVQASVPGEQEQPRVLLVSVPYALKAGDAETLGGRPLSAFVLASGEEASGEASGARKDGGTNAATRDAALSASAATTTPGQIAKFGAGGVPEDSIMTEGSGSIGIGTTSPNLSGAARALTVSTSGTESYLELNGVRTNDSTFAAIAGYNNGTETAAVNLVRDGANDAGAIYFRTRPAGGVGTDRAFITSTGSFEVSNLAVTRTVICCGGAITVQQNAASPNIIAGFTGNSVLPGLVGSSIGGGGANLNTNRVTDHFGTVGGGRNNQAGDNLGDHADAAFATAGGGEGNRANGLYATVGGGNANTASFQAATIGGGSGNRTFQVYATVGGGRSNIADGDYSSVGGGQSNRAAGGASTVSGGGGNRAFGGYSTVSGGAGNVASGSVYPAVGGGELNTASGESATVGGGNSNSASSESATVGGGRENTAGGVYAIVGGGFQNTAQGNYSFAAGRRAKANHDGAFVWADSADADLASTSVNQFIARAFGGVTFWSNAAATTGVTLAAGAGSWSSVSDRQAKENFAAVDGRELLKKLNAIPMETWNYRSQDASIRHLGPMAQEFYAAFGLGEDERRISAVDADGVALAAIQALYRMVEENDAQLEHLAEHLRQLQSEVKALRAPGRTQ